MSEINREDDHSAVYEQMLAVAIAEGDVEGTLRLQGVLNGVEALDWKGLGLASPAVSQWGAPNEVQFQAVNHRFNPLLVKLQNETIAALHPALAGADEAQAQAIAAEGGAYGFAQWQLRAALIDYDCAPKGPDGEQQRGASQAIADSWRFLIGQAEETAQIKYCELAAGQVGKFMIAADGQMTAWTPDVRQSGGIVWGEATPRVLSALAAANYQPLSDAREPQTPAGPPPLPPVTF
jgi:hypothetical protein